MIPLLPALHETSGTTASREAVRFGDHVLTYAQLAGASASLAHRIAGAGRVAVWATSTPRTVVAVVAALRAGVPAVPLNPRTGGHELAHILADSTPSVVLAGAGDELPAALDALERIDVDTAAVPSHAPPLEPPPESPALIVYTSGTTGPPKGAVLPRRAVAASLDALEDAWQWTGDDVLVHALPLFHVHGLILGVLGPLRRGGSVRHLGRFSVEGVARELLAGGTMLFGVPTMYHRLAGALADPAVSGSLTKALAGARLLVSGSAALPVHDHERIAAATGRRVIERYGMTETLMNTGVRADGAPRAGTVGPPLSGVELRLVEEDGSVLDDTASIGEIQVRGPNLFTGYLNRPDATAAAFTGDGWFRTGDMATIDADGYVRIVGRKATDLIKSGGYKIGAGEIENALLDHPGVREAAVTGEPDADLGERIVAWVVPADPASPPGARELADHVADRLAPHKRPRVVRYLDVLPRNELGKIMKRSLGV
ncbi:acyl-CoA synthetase [Streptomyces clavifer]|uniref:acyl-CoA synthetase n=1 Tax=Streptomyces TaxID=1883 RepID=UPI0029AB7138|nr:acyl-CoA synthetase [Streptomyces sp. ND04-05B]MDX3064895.1 acyl-CoA synthetase [Streptomyces sp. ND04-05B]